MGQKLDGRSDLFSVGNILYELSTGEKPFGGEALSTVMHKVIKTDPVPPTELNFAIPDALALVIMKALSKRPANRYKTGNEMAAALRESLKENPNPAILDPGASIALSSTMAAPAPAQATMISTPISEDLKSTLASARPATQETTLAEGNPSFTVPGAAPAPGATVAGPPPTAASEVGATMPGSAPAHIQPAPVTSTGPNKGLLIGGGIAVALVVIIGGFLMSGGEKERKLPTESAAPATAREVPAETPVASTDRFYTSAIFEIFRANTEDGYKRFVKKEATLDDLAGQLSEVKGDISIELLDSAGNIIVSAPTWSVGDLIEIPAQRKVSSMKYRVKIVDPARPGSEETYLGEVEAATVPDATANVPIIFGPASSG